MMMIIRDDTHDDDDNGGCCSTWHASSLAVVLQEIENHDGSQGVVFLSSDPNPRDAEEEQTT